MGQDLEEVEHVAHAARDLVVDRADRLGGLVFFERMDARHEVGLRVRAGMGEGPW